LPSTIEQVHREWSGRGLVVLALNIEESPEVVATWLEAHRVGFRVLLDPSGTMTKAYEVTATPTVFLVDRDGLLVAKALGTKPWTGEDGRALLAHLVGGS
jgi:peroxiredoxin